MAKQKTAKSLDAQARLRQSVNTVLAALLCILIGLLVGLIVLLIINPEHAWDQGFVRIIQGGFYDFPYGVGRTLVNGAPLIMTGLSVAFAFRTGLFNIGAAGQYTMGAFGGLYCALILNLPWYVCLLASMAGGAVWGGACYLTGWERPCLGAFLIFPVWWRCSTIIMRVSSASLSGSYCTVRIVPWPGRTVLSDAWCPS